MSDAFTLCDLCMSAYQATKHDPNATPKYNAIPFGDIYWSDEHPYLPRRRWAPLQHHAVPSSQNPCYSAIVNLVSARYHLWHHEPLTDELQQAWESARIHIPQWPGFCRTSYSQHASAVESFQQAQAAPLIALHQAITASPSECPHCQALHQEYRLIIPNRNLDPAYIICQSCGRSARAGEFNSTQNGPQTTA